MIRTVSAAQAQDRSDNRRVHIRAVEHPELPMLQDIERAAGQCFRTIGMAEIAEDEPLPLAVLATFCEAGRAWVATDHADAPIGYLIADVVDANLHVEQVSVHPSAARRGVGRRLIDHLAQEAVASKRAALTLTTFADVPWNAPYYLRCGFRIVADAEIMPGLQAIRAREADLGLDRWPRVCMKRETLF